MNLSHFSFEHHRNKLLHVMGQGKGELQEEEKGKYLPDGRRSQSGNGRRYSTLAATRRSRSSSLHVAPTSNQPAEIGYGADPGPRRPITSATAATPTKERLHGSGNRPGVEG